MTAVIPDKIIIRAGDKFPHMPVHPLQIDFGLLQNSQFTGLVSGIWFIFFEFCTSTKKTSQSGF